MMAIIDILIYIAFAFLASSLAKKSENYIEENNLPPIKWDKYLTYFVLFFTVIGGIRWNVGADSLSYAYWFAYPQSSEHTKESLWWMLVNFVVSNGLHWTIGLAICSFIQIFFITQTVKAYRWLLVFIPFVFFGGRYWLDCMNAVRQMMVACGFLWASKFIVERKVWHYIIFIGCAYLVHQSAVLLLPFYFMPSYFDITKKRVLLISILLICFVLGQTPAFQGFANTFKHIADLTNYEGYGNTMTQMILKDKTENALSFGPMMLTYLAIPIFIIWYGGQLREAYGKSIKYFNLWFNLAYFYACAYFLVCNINHMFIRPLMYFSLFQMVIAALLLNHLWKEYKLYGLRQSATILFCIIIFLNTGWDVFKASGYPPLQDTKTYKVFLFHTSKQKPIGI